jgi:RNA polymerase sigma factor (sigma-70 family)
LLSIINRLLLNHPSYTEVELVALLKGRDERAFNYLYDHYAAAMYGVIVKVIEQADTANDVMQETFVKIWKSIDQYDGTKGKLFTWMINIARNTAIDKLRSSSFRNQQRTTDITESTQAYQVLSTAANVEQIGLNKLVSGLKPEYRMVIDLAYFKGYTQEEISKELDMPVGTVKTHVRRALMELKKIFSR